ncbi:uncharacterized protein Dwil_GK27653 [Drosophila willistoni]|uniref:Fibrinogen C-terminal domain-containing protein n=1 Tax=Drosophila willistoni TaxID=7260 RepID=A0A0Q9WQD1_DROWI|nr:uncharacterized protein Dwil_GK27653 [Drosophila willistoni]
MLTVQLIMQSGKQLALKLPISATVYELKIELQNLLDIQPKTLDISASDVTCADSDLLVEVAGLANNKQIKPVVSCYEGNNFVGLILFSLGGEDFADPLVDNSVSDSSIEESESSVIELFSGSSGESVQPSTIDCKRERDGQLSTLKIEAQNKAKELEICKNSAKILELDSNSKRMKIDSLSLAKNDLESKLKLMEESYSDLQWNNTRLTEDLLNRNDEITKFKSCLSDVDQKKDLLASCEKTKGQLQISLNDLRSKGRTDASDFQTVYSTYCKSTDKSSTTSTKTLSYTQLFTVLCNDEVADSGWFVIHRRNVDNYAISFDLNWSSYKNGFGSFYADYFIGLEKLHRITSSYRHELYIYLEDFSHQVWFAKYDNFQIGNEEENYRLKSIGTYTGSAGDALSSGLNAAFSTYDRDNDYEYFRNCAKDYHGGWWYKSCTNR